MPGRAWHARQGHGHGTGRAQAYDLGPALSAETAAAGTRRALRCAVMSPADWDDLARQERRAPICPACGVTALPGSAVGAAADFVCDNADCEAFGEPV